MAYAFADPDELCREVARRYQGLATYRDEGVVSTRFLYSPESSMPESTERKHFRTLFVRPDSFRFEFRVEPPWGRLPESKWERYVTWTVSGVTREWWTLRPNVRERTTIFDAVGSSAGTSGGSSLRIVSLLVPGQTQHSPLPAAGEGAILDVEPVEKLVCHRLEFQRAPTRRTSLWVDTESLLIRRVREAIRFTRELQASLHRDAQEAIAKLPPGEGLTAKQRRFFEEHPPSVREEFVTESTTDYHPAVNQTIERVEFEADLPTE